MNQALARLALMFELEERIFIGRGPLERSVRYVEMAVVIRHSVPQDPVEPWQEGISVAELRCRADGTQQALLQDIIGDLWVRDSPPDEAAKRRDV